ncbi:MAG: tRNA (adenosine(37)-N6)-threonylcarbamoyltransferase complex ATPase subunit type 1 TsaE [Bdellovibrionia bacterium]
MTQEYVLHTVNDWPLFWKEFLKQKSEKLLLLFEGEVGAGKTTSIAAMAEFLQTERASSPSFAIHQSYQGKNGKHIDHVDLYRIESEAELEGTGFWDLFSQKSAIICVEWASRVKSEHWPLGWETWKITVTKETENSRKITTQLL